jgi:hypothetical protein
MLKNIILLILVLILAIALTIGTYIWLRFEFQTFTWEYGFFEFIVSIIAFFFYVANPINLFAYGLCGAAWKGVIYQIKEILGESSSNNYQSHATNTRKYGSSLNDFDDIHGSNEDKSYLYD